MLLDILPGDSIASLTNTDISVSKLDQILNRLFDYGVSFGMKLIAAAFVFIIGRWIIVWLRKFIMRVLAKRQLEETVKSFLDSLVNISLKITLFLMIVNILGISTTSFAAIFAAAGLAVGMAMKDNLSNFAGGVMILINKPFKVGDRIVAQGMDGSVQSIGILYTVLQTGDNRTIFMPNGPLSTGSITNFSMQKERRIDVTFNIGAVADLDNIKKSLMEVIKEDTLIKQTPAPFVGVTAVNVKTVDITIRCWVNTGDYGNVSVSLNEKIYNSLYEQGVYSTSPLSIKMLKD